jgi:non-ribosomal peptide synthetase component F
VAWTLKLTEELSAHLRRLGRENHSLPALVALSMYAGFVARWTKQSDFVLPFLIAGRHAEQDQIVGYFSHALYLRIQVGSPDTFLDLLKRVSNEFYRAMFHQDFGRITAARPDLSSGTLCQWLSWHPTEIAGPEIADLARQFGVHIREVPSPLTESVTNVPPEMLDLEVSFYESGGTIGVLTTHREGRFGRRWMRELEVAIRRFVEDPSARILAE